MSFEQLSHVTEHKKYHAVKCCRYWSGYAVCLIFFILIFNQYTEPIENILIFCKWLKCGNEAHFEKLLHIIKIWKILFVFVHFTRFTRSPFLIVSEFKKHPNRKQLFHQNVYVEWWVNLASEDMLDVSNQTQMILNRNWTCIVTFVYIIPSLDIIASVREVGLLAEKSEFSMLRLWLKIVSQHTSKLHLFYQFSLVWHLKAIVQWQLWGQMTCFNTFFINSCTSPE